MFVPGDFEDDFETNAVADEDIAAMAAEECQLTTLTSCRPTASRGVGLLATNGDRPVDAHGPLFFAVQVLDAAGVWTSLDERHQVMAAVAALYMCAKLHSQAQDVAA